MSIISILKAPLAKGDHLLTKWRQSLSDKVNTLEGVRNAPFSIYTYTNSTNNYTTSSDSGAVFDPDAAIEITTLAGEFVEVFGNASLTNTTATEKYVGLALTMDSTTGLSTGMDFVQPIVQSYDRSLVVEADGNAANLNIYGFVAPSAGTHTFRLLSVTEASIAIYSHARSLVVKVWHKDWNIEVT